MDQLQSMISPPECAGIPAGSFFIGCTSDDKFGNSHELPRREIQIAAFELGKTPVTEAQFAAFLGEVSDSNLPVIRVSWEDAQSYCAWLSEQTGESYRLPTEAEREYACRAGSTGPFPSGDMLDTAQVNHLYDENGNRIGPGQRLAVTWGQPNAFGLHDMLGNVCEWVADDWVSNYSTLSPNGAAQSLAPDSPTSLKVIRGGGWDYLPRLLRSSSRDFAPATTRRDNLGFRIAKEP